MLDWMQESERDGEDGNIFVYMAAHSAHWSLYSLPHRIIRMCDSS